MDFITIGDNKFFHTIGFSARQIKRFYPDSKLYIYDWGFTTEQKDKLEKFDNVVLTDWKNRLRGKEDFVFKKNWKFYISKYLLLNIFYRYTPQQRLRQFLFCEKVYCMLDAAIKYSGKLTFLDGDAFLVNNIDEVFSSDYDIGFTLRPLNEIEDTKKRGHYPINSGVIFFNTSTEKKIAFIIEWIKEMDLLNFHNIRLAEQTSLSFLAQRAGSDILEGYYKTGSLKIGDYTLRFKVFPCDKYNFNKIEEGVNKEENKILHFKGGRSSEEEFQRLIKDVELD